SVRLRSGQIIPVVVPRILGMFSWSAKVLAQHVLGPRPRGAEERAIHDSSSEAVINFLNRVYYDLRNLGVTAEDRALNYSATNMDQALEVLQAVTTFKLELDTIAVEKSPVCRPDSDCFDVKLSFFDPENERRADRVFKLTVDVTD